MLVQCTHGPCYSPCTDLADPFHWYHASHQVLNIGSGLGGPARYLAHKTGCHVLACELQHDLNATAQLATERAGLGPGLTSENNIWEHAHGGQVRSLLTTLLTTLLTARRSARCSLLAARCSLLAAHRR